MGLCGSSAWLVAHPPPPRAHDPRHRRKQRRLAAPVGAHHGTNLARAQIEVQLAQDPPSVAVIAEPEVVCDDQAPLVEAPSRGPVGRASPLQRICPRAFGAPCPAPCAGSVRTLWAGLTWGGAQRLGTSHLLQRDLPHAPLRELERARRVVKHRLGRVGGHHHGDAQLAVHAEEHREEVLLGKGVEHARRLVKQKQARPHGERRCEGEKLALPAGELRRALAEPRPHAKERACLRHAPARFRLRDSEVLQAEGHLVPDGLADDLRVRALEDVAHGARGGERPQRAHVLPEGAHRAGELAGRGDLRLDETQHRGLS